MFTSTFDCAEPFIDDAVCARDAGDFRDVHPNGHRAIRVGAELLDGTLERPIIAPGKHDAKPLCEQLTAGLQPPAAVRAGDERDAYAGGCHRRILIGVSAELGCSTVSSFHLSKRVAVRILVRCIP